MKRRSKPIGRVPVPVVAYPGTVTAYDGYESASFPTAYMRNTGGTSDSPTTAPSQISTEIVKKGTKSAKSISVGAWNRSEHIYDGPDGDADTGNLQYFIDHWWGFSVYPPSASWNAGGAEAIVMQNHSTGTTFLNPNLSLFIQTGNTWSFNLTGTGPGWTLGGSPSSKQITLGAVAFDTWTDFVVHVRYSYVAYNTGTNVVGNAACGIAELWKDGVKLVGTGGSLYDWSGPWYGDTDESAGNGGPIIKMGLYGNIPVSRYIYHDEFRYSNDGNANHETVAPWNY